MNTVLLNASVQEWAIKREVVTHLYDYLAALDDRRFEDAAALFTADGVLQFGETALVSPEVILGAMRRQLAPLDLTHHMASNPIVTLLAARQDGADARLRAQALGTHVWREDGEPRQALLGGAYEASLRQEEGGWRFTRLAPAFLWTRGDRWEH